MSEPGPGRGWTHLICLCEFNRTYCPHREGMCPWWDREPQDPTWHKVPDDDVPPVDGSSS